MPKHILRTLAIMVLGILTMVGLGWLYNSCTSRGPVKHHIRVDIETDHEPVREAMNLWNSAIGCDAFVEGKDVRYMSTDGEPCGCGVGDDCSDAIDDSATAGTYRCGEKNRGWKMEVHVSRPGDVRTQTCIALHELGRVAGLPTSDDHHAVMHPEWCPPDGVLLWPRDSEAAAVRKALCL